MPELSPEAQVVLDAYEISADGHYDDDGVWVPHIRKQLAAALRAAASQLAYRNTDHPIIDEKDLFAIADELEEQ